MELVRVNDITGDEITGTATARLFVASTDGGFTAYSFTYVTDVDGEDWYAGADVMFLTPGHTLPI